MDNLEKGSSLCIDDLERLKGTAMQKDARVRKILVLRKNTILFKNVQKNWNIYIKSGGRTVN